MQGLSEVSIVLSIVFSGLDGYNGWLECGVLVLRGEKTHYGCSICMPTLYYRQERGAIY